MTIILITIQIFTLTCFGLLLRQADRPLQNPLHFFGDCASLTSSFQLPIFINTTFLTTIICLQIQKFN